jgi:hypothetical protein
VKKCLNEVLKYGGTFSARDLYPVRRPFLNFLSPRVPVSDGAFSFSITSLSFSFATHNYLRLSVT